MVEVTPSLNDTGFHFVASLRGSPQVGLRV